MIDSNKYLLKYFLSDAQDAQDAQLKNLYSAITYEAIK